MTSSNSEDHHHHDDNDGHIVVFNGTRNRGVDDDRIVDVENPIDIYPTHQKKLKPKQKKTMDSSSVDHREDVHKSSPSPPTSPSQLSSEQKHRSNNNDNNNDDDDDNDNDDDTILRRQIHELSNRIDDDLLPTSTSPSPSTPSSFRTNKNTNQSDNVQNLQHEKQQQQQPKHTKTNSLSDEQQQPTLDPNSWKGRCYRIICCQLGWDFDTFVWSLRLSVGLTIASLFVLIQPSTTTTDNNGNGDGNSDNSDDRFVYPEGIWVFITVAVTGWVPRTDVATVFQKCIRRIQGTTYSAALGLLIGYCSYAIYEATNQNRTAQAIFMGTSIAVYGFVHSYIVDRIGLRNSYSTTLGSFTFGVSLFGFLNHDQPWLNGTMRVVNIFIGIILSCIIAITIFPLSTQSMVQQNVTQLVTLTAESIDLILGEAEALLLSDSPDSSHNNNNNNGKDNRRSSHFSSTSGYHDSGSSSHGGMVVPPMSLVEKISTDSKDTVHAKYIEAVDMWKSCRALIPLLEMDPFRGCSGTPAGHDLFSKQQRVIIARCFRMQVNAISIDSLCRANHILASSGSQLLLSSFDSSNYDDDDRDGNSCYADARSWLGNIRQNIRIIFDIDGSTDHDTGEEEDQRTTIANRRRAIRNLVQKDLTIVQQQLKVLQERQYQELHHKYQHRRGATGVDGGTHNDHNHPDNNHNRSTLERMMTPSYDNHPLRHASNGSIGQAILFLQLLEYLILRVAQFYVFWNQHYRRDDGVESLLGTVAV